MRIAALKETAPDETRVAVTPETVRKFGVLGATVAVGAFTCSAVGVGAGPSGSISAG